MQFGLANAGAAVKISMAHATIRATALRFMVWFTSYLQSLTLHGLAYTSCE